MRALLSLSLSFLQALNHPWLRRPGQPSPEHRTILSLAALPLLLGRNVLGSLRSLLQQLLAICRHRELSRLS